MIKLACMMMFLVSLNVGESPQAAEKEEVKENAASAMEALEAEEEGRTLAASGSEEAEVAENNAAADDAANESAALTGAGAADTAEIADSAASSEESSPSATARPKEPGRLGKLAYRPGLALAISLIASFSGISSGVSLMGTSLSWTTLFDPELGNRVFYIALVFTGIGVGMGPALGLLCALGKRLPSYAWISLAARMVISIVGPIIVGLAVTKNSKDNTVFSPRFEMAYYGWPFLVAMAAWGIVDIALTPLILNRQVKKYDNNRPQMTIAPAIIPHGGGIMVGARF